MKFILRQTGGLLGRTREAQAETDFTLKDWKALCKTIRVKVRRQGGDNLQYFLLNDEQETGCEIDIERIPKRFRPVFDELFNNLKVKK